MNAEMPAWSRVLFEEHWRHIAIHGGRGSSKSHSVARALLIRASQKTLRILCAREIQDSIKKSVKQLLDDCIESMGLRWFFTSTDSEIRGQNGSLFIFAGLLRNIDSVKSMEGVDICWVEEAQSVSKRSIDVLIPTIRKPGSQLIWVWNPTKPTDPVDRMFRSGRKLRDDETVVEVNYRDNPWFTDVLKSDMLRDRESDAGNARHVWDGAYLVRSKANIFSDWDIVTDENAPIIPPGMTPRYGADWGFTHPTTLIRCWVLENKRTIYIEEEAYGEGVDVKDTPALFATVTDAHRYPIYADPARPETISHMRQFFNKQVQPAKKGANSVEEGVKWLMGYRILVHERCEHTIFELENYKRKVDPKTLEVQDEIEDAHNHCIAEGERVLTERGYVPIEHVTTSDRVMTRGGWRSVLFADVTDVDRDLVRVTTTVGSFLCTPDHEVWTSKGFVRADALRYDDEVIGDEQWASLTTSKQLNGAEKHGGATQAVSSDRTGATSQGVQQTGPYGCIVLSGPQPMERSHEDTTSTTSMATRETTLSRILSASRQNSTQQSTHGQQSESNASGSISIAFDPSPARGTPQKQVSSSIDESARLPMKSLSLQANDASNAGAISSPVQSATVIDFAQTSAGPLTVAQAVSTTLSACVSAEHASLSTDTARSRLVPGRVVHVQEAGRCERVYDLTVDEHHEFVVEGVLVSNCMDALRYAVESDRRAPKAVPVVIPEPIASRW